MENKSSRIRVDETDIPGYTWLMMGYQGVKREITSRVQRFDAVMDANEKLLTTAGQVLAMFAVCLLVFTGVCLTLAGKVK